MMPLREQDISKLSKYARDVLAWLGFWRDKIPNEAVESLQGIIESNETEFLPAYPSIPLGYMGSVEIHNLAVKILDRLNINNARLSGSAIGEIEEAIQIHAKENKEGKVFHIEHLDASHIRLTPVKW